MNILLYTKLSDSTFYCIIQPLVLSKHIDHIYIIRDSDILIKSEKLTIINSSKPNSKNKLRHFKRVYKGLVICKKYKIDLVIGIHLYPHGYIARIISFLTGLPLIHMTIAGHREFWVPGKLIEKLNLFIFRNISAITVTGEKTRNYLIKNKFDPEKVFILPNVIDFENFYLNNKTIKEFDLISISRLDKNKNISLLLRAIAKIKERKQIKALIAGVGEEGNSLKQEAKMLGIEGNVHFAGWIEEEDKNDLYNKSGIFVLCSKGEGFPLALLEAMACGCVPVVSDVGDISDLIINEENGIIYNDIDNEEELAKIIENLINNSDRMLKMSIQAQDVKNKLSFDNVSKIWDNILSSIKFLN